MPISSSAIVPGLHPIFESVYAFSPNRHTMGGTAYLVVASSGNILVDCPCWDATTEAALDHYSGIRWFVITHRDGMGTASMVKQIKEKYSCEVVVQEQEAYLLPDLAVQPFEQMFTIADHSRLIWTPGYSPGSSCLYYSGKGGILFTGRHLLPNAKGSLMPLRMAKTFHWFRQLSSVQRLLDEFSEDTLQFCCPGANTGFLRRQRVVSHAYQQLCDLDLDLLRAMKPGL